MSEFPRPARSFTVPSTTPPHRHLPRTAAAALQQRAWVFAGHGSQYPGMGRGFAFETPEVCSIFVAAEDASGLPLRTLSRHAGADELACPTVLEPLLAAMSLAYAARLAARGHQPRAVAGYSAGLVPALACAGVLDVQSALTLAVRRGALLAEAAPRCRGAMFAVHGLPVPRMLAVLQGLREARDVDVAGWNSPTHLTLAGARAPVQAAAAALVGAGAKSLEVPVAGAWHSRRAAGLAERCARLFDGLAFRAPRLPVYSSVSARREDDPRRLREHLAQQIEAPVYWQATLASLCAGEGLRDVLEVGCGRVLAGLQGAAARHTTPAVVFSNLFDQLKADHA